MFNDRIFSPLKGGMANYRQHAICGDGMQFCQQLLGQIDLQMHDAILALFFLPTAKANTFWQWAKSEIPGGSYLFASGRRTLHAAYSLQYRWGLKFWRGKQSFHAVHVQARVYATIFSLFKSRETVKKFWYGFWFRCFLLHTHTHIKVNSLRR